LDKNPSLLMLFQPLAGHALGLGDLVGGCLTKLCPVYPDTKPHRYQRPDKDFAVSLRFIRKVEHLNQVRTVLVMELNTLSGLIGLELC
jgi:hypothetical protein